MTHIQVYVDESGPTKSYFSIAGAMAPLMCWAQLMRAWDRRLAAEGITVMHATAFARFRKPFQDKKKWPAERREVLLRELLDLTHQHIIDVGRGLYFGTMGRGLEKRRMGDIYASHFVDILHLISREMDHRWPKLTVSVVVANHPAVSTLRVFANLAKWSAVDRRAGGHTVGASPDVNTGLQVADLLAYLFGEQFQRTQRVTPFFSHMTRGHGVELYPGRSQSIPPPAP